MSTKDAKNRLRTIERWWLKPSSLKLCIYYEVINKWCWQTQSLHKSSNSLPHRVPSIQDWVAKWRSGEVAKTHYILLYRASSGGNKSSHNRTDSTSTTSTYQRKYWIYWKHHRLSSPREIDSPPYFSRDMIATISLDQRTRCIMGLLFASHAIVLQRFRVNITPNRLFL